ncbi:unnamed protein product [Microthlaspi erraticum]|uniref:TIR domain-containing protein n=1 Tax=Microthlaspi erraticum TaxID=1685480 RepID=A0A6D2JKR7_9BRAS|nr:unnamed protein product [Microthlaspi erraticum]
MPLEDLECRSFCSQRSTASSSWCLDELLEILNCKEALGHIVMIVFYDVDLSNVRKQKGDFGSAFMETCQGKGEEVKEGWIKALTDVANIEGEIILSSGLTKQI